MESAAGRYFWARLFAPAPRAATGRVSGVRRVRGGVPSLAMRFMGLVPTSTAAVSGFAFVRNIRLTDSVAPLYVASAAILWAAARQLATTGMS